MSYVDPLDVMLGEATSSPVQSQSPVAVTVTEKKSSGGFQWAIVGLLVGVMAVLLWQRLDGQYGFFKGSDQHQEQKQDAALNGVVFVHERNPLSIEHDLVLREMPKWCEQHKLPKGYRSYDDDMTDPIVVRLKEQAATKGVSPPFIALIDVDGNPVRVVPFVDMSSMSKVLP